MIQSQRCYYELLFEAPALGGRGMMEAADAEAKVTS